MSLHLSSLSAFKKEFYVFMFYAVLTYLHNKYDKPAKCANHIVVLQRPYTDYPHHPPYHREAIIHATVPICFHAQRYASFDFKKIVMMLCIKRCSSIYTMYGFERNDYSRTYHLFIDRFLWR